MGCGHDHEVAWPGGHFCCDVVALQDLKSEVFAWPSGTAPGESAAGLSPPMPSAAAEVLPGPGRRRLWPFNLCSSVTGRLHGLVSLEIAGNFASMGIDPSEVFEIQLATLTA